MEMSSMLWQGGVTAAALVCFGALDSLLDTSFFHVIPKNVGTKTWSSRAIIFVGVSGDPARRDVLLLK